MRMIRLALPVMFAVASIPFAFAQGPADPSGWGEGARTAAQDGVGNGVSDEVLANQGDRGLANARHDFGEVDTHPTPPGREGDYDPLTELPVPVGFF